MNTNSNSYTIIYASVMVVIVAFLLAFVSSSLKDLQNKNVEMDTKKQILAALNVRNVADPEAEYNKYVKADMLMQEDGTLKENDGKFATSYEKEVKENGRLHVFVCEVDGQTKYVFPVYGVGLWGAIWGYVALDDDKDTVYGVYFSHASETRAFPKRVSRLEGHGRRPGGTGRGEERQGGRCRTPGGRHFRRHHHFGGRWLHAERLSGQLHEISNQ